MPMSGRRAQLRRGALIRAVIDRERRRREAQAQAAWDSIWDTIAQIAERLAARPYPGDRELAEQLACAGDWPAIDELRSRSDRSRVECVALVMLVDKGEAMRLLSTYRSDADTGGSLEL